MAARYLILIGFLAGCTLYKDPQKLSEEGASAQRLASQSSDAASSVTCELSNQTTAPTTFLGKNVRYFSAEEINYASDSWWKEDQPWISAEALSSAQLKHPGFKSSSRNAVVSQTVNVRMMVVDIRKVNGKLVYHYFSNGTGNNPLENWSSTKGLSMIQAAHTMRQNYKIPFNSRVYTNSDGSGFSGWTSDHVTQVARTSDNNYAGWIKSITGGQGSHNFVRNWLGGNATNTAFGGSHGGGPKNLGKYFDQGPGTAKTYIKSAGAMSSFGDNTLMPILMTEFWKRVGVNRNEPSTWLKKANYAGTILGAAAKKRLFFGTETSFSVQDEDLMAILYGNPNSSSDGGLQLAVTQFPEYVDAFGGKRYLDKISNGKWRIFGKLGYGGGEGSRRNRDEMSFGGTFCIPADSARTVMKEGRQIAFFLNVQAKEVADGLDNEVLRGISRAMIPELTGSPDLWK